jgi:hypothetical protein
MPATETNSGKRTNFGMLRNVEINTTAEMISSDQSQLKEIRNLLVPSPRVAPPGDRGAKTLDPAATVPSHRLLPPVAPRGGRRTSPCSAGERGGGDLAHLARTRVAGGTCPVLASGGGAAGALFSAQALARDLQSPPPCSCAATGGVGDGRPWLATSRSDQAGAYGQTWRPLPAVDDPLWWCYGERAWLPRWGLRQRVRRCPWVGGVRGCLPTTLCRCCGGGGGCTRLSPSFHLAFGGALCVAADIGASSTG